MSVTTARATARTARIAHARTTRVTPATSTTERYLHAVRDAIVAYAVAEGAITEEQATRLMHAKLLYGIGEPGVRGVCHYEAWENGIGKVDVIEIAAGTQESWVQLAGTTLHELGHALAGWGSAHGPEWKSATLSLGFTKRPAAAGQRYALALFAPALRHAIYALAQRLDDGTPAFRTSGLYAGLFAGAKLKPCSAGVGTKGGTSRGTGSGSRQRLWECGCERPVKVRVASDDFQATCNRCSEPFHRA